MTVTHPNRKLGYLRESTDKQELGLIAQRNRLNAYGCDKIYEDGGQSGSTNITGSAVWAALVADLKPGDELVVTSQSRLGRKSYEVTYAVGKLIEVGVGVHVMDDKRTYNDLDDFEQNLMLGVNSSKDHNERVVITQRTKAGLSVLKDAGVQLGRKPKLNSRQVAQITELRERGFGYKTIGKLILVAPRKGAEPAPIGVGLVKRALSGDYSSLEAWEAANAKARSTISLAGVR